MMTVNESLCLISFCIFANKSSQSALSFCSWLRTTSFINPVPLNSPFRGASVTKTWLTATDVFKRNNIAGVDLSLICLPKAVEDKTWMADKEAHNGNDDQSSNGRISDPYIWKDDFHLHSLKANKQAFIRDQIRVTVSFAQLVASEKTSS